MNLLKLLIDYDENKEIIEFIYNDYHYYNFDHISYKRINLTELLYKVLLDCLNLDSKWEIFKKYYEIISLSDSENDFLFSLLNVKQFRETKNSLQIILN